MLKKLLYQIVVLQLRISISLLHVGPAIADIAIAGNWAAEYIATESIPENHPDCHWVEELDDHSIGAFASPTVLNEIRWAEEYLDKQIEGPL